MKTIHSDFQDNKDSLMLLLRAAVEKENFSYKNRDCLVTIHPELTKNDLNEILLKGIDGADFLQPWTTEKRGELKTEQPLLINGSLFKEPSKTKKSGRLKEVYPFILQLYQGKALRLRMEIQSMIPDKFEEICLEETAKLETRNLLDDELESAREGNCCAIL